MRIGQTSADIPKLVIAVPYSWRDGFCADQIGIGIGEQAAVIILSDAPLASVFGFVLDPLAFDLAVAVVGFGVVDPIIQTMHQTIRFVFNIA